MVLIVGFASLLITEKYINKKFDAKSLELAENILLSITIVEEEMDKTLKASALLVQEKLLNGSIKTDADLSILRKQLGVTVISILNGKDGKFALTSNEVFDRKNLFYQQLSLTDINQCATQKCGNELCRSKHEILNCQIKRFEVLNAIQNPNTPIVLPMIRVTLHSATPIKSPAKWVVLYNKNLDKIIDIFYTKNELSKTLEDHITINANYINYIDLVDDRGNLIAEAGARNGKKSKIISLSSNNNWKFNFNNENINYSYTLNIEFSKQDLSNQILVMRILFITIIILLLILMSIFKFILTDKEGDFNKVRNILIKHKIN